MNTTHYTQKKIFANFFVKKIHFVVFFQHNIFFKKKPIKRSALKKPYLIYILYASIVSSIGTERMTLILDARPALALAANFSSSLASTSPKTFF